MSIRDGGKNVDREKYYDNLGATYWNANEQLDSYHAMRMTSFLGLVDAYINKSMDVFDFGCGTGETILPLIARGLEVSGCDISQSMVDKAQTIDGVGKIEKGGIEIFRQKKSLGNVIALNVLPYLTEDEEKDFYEQLTSLMKPGAVFIGSHTNLLFDLFTFNRYTIDFFNDHLLQYFPVEQHQFLKSELKKLVTFPELPDRDNQTWLGAGSKPAASERDKINKRRVDPFEYPQEVEKFGFSLIELKPVNVFAFPPLVTEKSKEIVLSQHKIQEKIKNHTLAKLLCSQFQFAFVKN